MSAKIKFFVFFPLMFCASLVLAQNISEHGYRYFHHHQKGGKKAKPGEAMIAHVDVFAGQTLLSSSRKTSAGTYRFEVDEKPEHYPPLYDAAMIMGIGDSLTIYQEVDEYMRQYLPASEKGAKEIRFEVVMLNIITLEQKAAAAKALEAAVSKIAFKVENTVRAYTTGLLDAQLLQRPSGLKMLIEDIGRGDAIRVGEPVQVHYYGCLTDGSSFDNSYSRRQPLQFPAGVGQMIAGFDEGVLQLRHGGRAYLFIPPSLAYGEEGASGGAVPPNAELIFYIEIL